MGFSSINHKIFQKLLKKVFISVPYEFFGRKKEARLFNLMKNLKIGRSGRRRRRRRRTYYRFKGRHLWCVLGHGACAQKDTF
jgi:hypothetical protein